MILPLAPGCTMFAVAQTDRVPGIQLSPVRSSSVVPFAAGTSYRRHFPFR